MVDNDRISFGISTTPVSNLITSVIRTNFVCDNSAGLIATATKFNLKRTGEKSVDDDFQCVIH